MVFLNISILFPSPVLLLLYTTTTITTTTTTTTTATTKIHENFEKKNKISENQKKSKIFPWASQGTPGTSQGPRENFRFFFFDFSKILDFFPIISWIFVVVVVVPEKYNIYNTFY